MVSTRAVTFPCDNFPHHGVYIAPGIKLSNTNSARLSGVAFLFRKRLKPYFEQIHVEYENMIVLQISSQLFSLNSGDWCLPPFLPIG